MYRWSSTRGHGSSGVKFWPTAIVAPDAANCSVLMARAQSASAAASIAERSTSGLVVTMDPSQMSTMPRTKRSVWNLDIAIKTVHRPCHHSMRAEEVETKERPRRSGGSASA